MPPVPRPAKRVLLGTKSSFAERQRVYRTPDGLEVEEIERFMVTVRRVFYDDVVAVTYHHYVGWPFLLACGLLAAWFSLIALVAGAGGGWLVGLVVFALAPGPFMAAFVLRVAMGVDVVTVHGKRTKAQIHFWLRKQRGRELFNQICRLARERQDRLARELAAEERVP